MALLDDRAIHRPALPDDHQRAEARRLYGADPVGYEAGRPDYPERVFGVLTARCGLDGSSTVVEIGAGTGSVARRLTALGARVLAIEPDHALAAYLRESMDSTRVDVLESSFEDAPIGEGRYDIAVAAMSFHWVNH